MNTILEYLADEDVSFEERPFGAVDAMALSLLCMIDADSIAARFPLALGALTISEEFPSRPKDFNADLVEKLVELITSSTRFSEVLAVDYLNLQEEGEDTQFAAYTFEFDKDFIYVAFRGTDTSFGGWYESFQLAAEYPTAAQRAALYYLEETAQKYPDYPIVVGGHSKGGTLATFAAMEASSQTRLRLARVYNFDGPGFIPEAAKEHDYARIRDIVQKFIPEFSFFGLIFEPHRDFIVVESKGKGFDQHNLFTWNLDGTNLILADRVSPSAEALNELIEQWVLDASQDQRKVIIEALFEAVQASGAESAHDLLNENPLYFITLIRASIKHTSPEAKRTLSSALKKFVLLVLDRTKKQVWR